MTPYEAMMKAADFIERNPNQYSFMNGLVPKTPDGCTSCMLGWTGFFLSSKRRIHSEIATELGMQSVFQLYEHGEFPGYHRSAALAAEKMRSFAKATFKPEEPASPSIEPAFLKFKKLLEAEIAAEMLP